jgi:outer membrane protein TolC
MKRALFLVLICLAVIAGRSPAAEPVRQAQDFRETPSPFEILNHQWSDYPPPPAAYSLEFLRTGDGETAPLTLKEAIFVGLKNNPGIEVDRLEPLRAAEQTMTEKSIFDPTLNLEFHKDYAVELHGTDGSVGSRFFPPVQNNQNRDYNLSLRKLLITGAQFEFSFLNNVYVATLQNQVLKPQYQPRVAFTLSQPLLRDFGWGLTKIFVRISENREGIGVLGYQTRLAQFVQRITEAYWGLVFAKENLTVQQKGVEWADALYKSAESRVRAGVLAPVAVVEAQAEKARREEQVIVAENDLDLARKTLRLTLNLNPDNLFMPRQIEPNQRPSVDPVPIDRGASLESALTRRPEILSAGLTVQNQTLQARYAENQLLPRLDFKAGAGLTGMSGEIRPCTTIPCQTNPFPGDYSRSLDRLGTGDFYNYSVGVVLQIPLSNAQARSKYSQARIELEQAQARRRDLVSQITLEVEKSLGDQESGFKRVQTTRRARELAEENLRGQERRFEVGLVTQKDVIDFQARLLDAQGAELRAVTDYNNSIARLKLAEGTLLESYNVQVEGPKKESDPWWARF